uniref:Uncharacterized protein n=1 Tax=Cacopsylla melanoneura TaxID=428564 RepID=A0A8D9BIR6_9HEMI
MSLCLMYLDTYSSWYCLMSFPNRRFLNLIASAGLILQHLYVLVLCKHGMKTLNLSQQGQNNPLKNEEMASFVSFYYYLHFSLSLSSGGGTIIINSGTSIESMVPKESSVSSVHCAFFNFSISQKQ